MSQSGICKGGAQASRRRLQDLADLQAGGELEAGLEQQLVALLGAAGSQLRTVAAGLLPRTSASRSSTQEAALVARGALAGDPAAVGPASHRARADAEQIGSLLHAQPFGVRSALIVNDIGSAGRFLTSSAMPLRQPTVVRPQVRHWGVHVVYVGGTRGVDSASVLRPCAAKKRPVTGRGVRCTTPLPEHQLRRSAARQATTSLDGPHQQDGGVEPPDV